MSRRAKIVCTLGPATASQERVAALVEAGMDVARLNFSHGTHAEHEQAVERVRSAAERAGRPVGLLADLQGPKMRLGRFADGPVEWRAGDRVTITTEDEPGTAQRVSTTYPRLADDVSPGDRLLVDDGNVGLVVVAVRGADVVCEVTEGGPVSDHKGLSLPGIAVSEPALSGKDADDLRFALGLGVDLVALSFVRSAADAGPVREVLAERCSAVPVLAKLEKPEAVAELDAVLAAFTQTGDTARRLARHRARTPVIAFTPDPAVRGRLTLSWGVETHLTPAVANTDDMVAAVQDALLSTGRGRPGDLVVVVAGSPPSVAGRTNLLRVHRLGEAAAG